MDDDPPTGHETDRPVPPGPEASLAPFGPLPRRVVLALGRPLITVTAVLVVYYLLPLDRRFGWGTVGALLAGLAVIALVAVWQIRAVVRAPHPTLRAMEALAFTIPVFLVLFASAYVILDASLERQFSEPLTRTDALYFVVTVFATVGFGDISPVSQTARVLVTLQIVSNLLLLGLVLKAMTAAVQRRNSGRWGGVAGSSDEGEARRRGVPRS